MRQSLFLVLFLASTLLIIGCGAGTETGSDSPTEAYKRLYSAVKSKDTEAIKQQVSQKTMGLAQMSSQRFNKPIEAAYENGFTGTTFSETLPSIRDERVKDNMGSVEVWNAKESKWEDLPFIFEDGAWKLAIGDAFSGTFQSPGKGRDLIEREAANSVTNRTVVLPSNGQANNSVNNKTSAPSTNRSPAK